MNLPSHRLALIVMAAILIVTIGGCAAPPANQSVPGTTQTQGPADPQVADAIQQVIQLGNTEQTQAIANRDPSVMSDTATGRYRPVLPRGFADL